MKVSERQYQWKRIYDEVLLEVLMPRECISEYKITLAVTALLSEFKPLMKSVDK